MICTADEYYTIEVVLHFLHYYDISCTESDPLFIPFKLAFGLVNDPPPFPHDIIDIISDYLSLYLQIIIFSTD